MTLSDLAPLALSPLQLRWIFTELLRRQAVSQDLDDTAAAAVITAELLQRRVGFLKEEQRQLILQSLREAFAQIPGPQQILLVIADSRWLTYSGLQGYVDLQTGDELQGLPYPCVEALSYNLSQLYIRRQKGTEHGRPETAIPGSTDQP